MSFVTLRGLSKQLPDRPLFDNLHLSIQEGELITLLGPSGCGKSTLLRALAGLTPIDGGQILMAGEEITHRAPQQRQIGMVFQHYALFPNMTVAGNVGFGLKMQGVPEPERRERVMQMLELVELAGKANAMPGELSGGQQQRVALARALAVRPRLLLLDEPLSALDARIRRHLRSQIRELVHKLGVTTVFVTHDQEEALLLSDRIVLMQDGQIVQTGTAEEIYARPVNRFAARFIGHYNLLDAETARRLLGHQGQGYLAIRPECIQLQPQAQGQARVLGHQLLGNVVRYQVQWQDQRLDVDTLNQGVQGLLPPGTLVALQFQTDQFREVA
ncbi:ABC transporter ATP-binding protein [Pseudaeromonas paramecii]|uniref:ABC transporter ATP-binding protein n=1 Tax=Pseudaeromonas paramecii TaxID=2138166 RepID=A0ABP8PVX8_9GAMM